MASDCLGALNSIPVLLYSTLFFLFDVIRKDSRILGEMLFPYFLGVFLIKSKFLLFFELETKRDQHFVKDIIPEVLK
jgi:hypothetical protein